MSEIISIDEIKSLYKKCGISSEIQHSIRTDINKGTLSNKLVSKFTDTGNRESAKFLNYDAGIKKT